MRVLMVFIILPLLIFADEQLRVPTEHAKAVSNLEFSIRKRTLDERKVSRIKPELCFGTVFWKSISNEDEELWFKSEIGIEYPLDANQYISKIEKYATKSDRLHLLNCSVSKTEEKIMLFNDFVNLTEQETELASKKMVAILLPAPGKFFNEDISGRGYVISNVVRTKDGSVSFSMKGLKTENYTCKESNRCVREDGKYPVTLLSATKLKTEEGVFSHEAAERWNIEQERRKEIAAEEQKYAALREAEAQKERAVRERISACEARCKQKYESSRAQDLAPIGRMRPYADKDSMAGTGLLLAISKFEKENCIRACQYER